MNPRLIGQYDQVETEDTAETTYTKMREGEFVGEIPPVYDNRSPYGDMKKTPDPADLDHLS